MQPSAVSCQDLKCSDIVANARGGKQSALTPPLKILLQNVTTPWQVSADDNTSDRKSFDLRTTPEIQDFCKRLDQKLITFAKQLGCKEENYKSLLKESKGDYEPTLRTKITIGQSGKSSTKFFEYPSKRRMSDSEIAELDFRECKFNMLLRISSIWINAGSFGCTASPEAIMVKKLDEFPEALAFESAEEDLGNF